MWLQTGYVLDIGSIDHLQVISRNNYNTIADFHTTNHFTLKSSQSAFTSRCLVTALNNGFFLCNVFTRPFLVTNFKNGDSSASVVTPLPAGQHSTTELSTPFIASIIFKINPRHGPCRKHSPSTADHFIAYQQSRRRPHRKQRSSVVVCMCVAGFT
jgi:hypothetical protein